MTFFYRLDSKFFLYHGNGNLFCVLCECSDDSESAVNDSSTGINLFYLFDGGFTVKKKEQHINGMNVNKRECEWSTIDLDNVKFMGKHKMKWFGICRISKLCSFK